MIQESAYNSGYYYYNDGDPSEPFFNQYGDGHITYGVNGDELLESLAELSKYFHSTNSHPFDIKYDHMAMFT